MARADWVPETTAILLFCRKMLRKMAQKWPYRLKILILISLALASWLVVGAIAYAVWIASRRI